MRFTKEQWSEIQSDIYERCLSYAAYSRETGIPLKTLYNYKNV